MSNKLAVYTPASDACPFIAGPAVAKVRRRIAPIGTSQGTAPRI
ncbi:hypothetical protein [Georgenia yuyongxinii]|nr:hypothetical protein [Georgenia yuyongxinii]